MCANVVWTYRSIASVQTSTCLTKTLARSYTRELQNVDSFHWHKAHDRKQSSNDVSRCPCSWQVRHDSSPLLRRWSRCNAWQRYSLNRKLFKRRRTHCACSAAAAAVRVDVIDLWTVDVWKLDRTNWQDEYIEYKKLGYCSETARCFVSFEISIS